MLTLIFSRAAKRRVVGLLALGEWGPPTGAPVDVTGTVSSDQPGQESLLSGTVAEPVVTVVGGGGIWRGRLLPQFDTKIPEVTGFISSEQPRQESQLTGDMVDTELEMLTAILLQIA